MRFSKLFILSYCWITLHPVLGADLIHDTSSLDQIRIGVNQVYNCEFDAAEYTLAYLRESYPDHPVTPFFEGLIYYWKYYPLMPGGPGAGEFEKVMEETWERSRLLKEDGNQIEGVFFELMSRSFIVMYYADNGRSSRAISHLGKIYRDIISSIGGIGDFRWIGWLTILHCQQWDIVLCPRGSRVLLQKPSSLKSERRHATPSSIPTPI